MHLQICCGALQWLKERNIMHPCIRPAVILLTERGPIYAQLTGFSEWCEGPRSRRMVGLPKFQAPEMQADSVYEAAVDIYSVCALTQKTLSSTNQMLPITRTDLENLVTSGMLQHPETRPTPLEMQETITDLIGGYSVDWSPFTFFTISKRDIINATRQEHDDFTLS